MSLFFYIFVQFLILLIYSFHNNIFTFQTSSVFIWLYYNKESATELQQNTPCFIDVLHKYFRWIIQILQKTGQSKSPYYWNTLPLKANSLPHWIKIRVKFAYHKKISLFSSFSIWCACCSVRWFFISNNSRLPLEKQQSVEYFSNLKNSPVHTKYASGRTVSDGDQDENVKRTTDFLLASFYHRCPTASFHSMDNTCHYSILPLDWWPWNGPWLIRKKQYRRTILLLYRPR